MNNSKPDSPKDRGNALRFWIAFALTWSAGYALTIWGAFEAMQTLARPLFTD